MGHTIKVPREGSSSESGGLSNGIKAMMGVDVGATAGAGARESMTMIAIAEGHATALNRHEVGQGQ